MITITKERLLTIKQWRETYGPGSNVVLPAEEAEELVRIALASLEREQIRHEHAKWSDSTFGCVGPIGPLKHLSKEALEAAAEPDDLSEWADMQFLLWDAQRRAGISDAEITVAMEDKLKINMERQ
ncbi:dATP/dGTP pyrophosphohydrolase domain-containing protein [Escherichia coli]